MMSLVSAALVCGVFAVGVRRVVKRRGKHAPSWLTPAERRTGASETTRVYIVRCWEEASPRDKERVMRYVLGSPATGRRRGYTRAEALVEALSQELRA